jgi:hypothetical protein
MITYCGTAHSAEICSIPAGLATVPITRTDA